MSKVFYLDASALAKRYILELGSAEMLHLFAHVSPDRLAVMTIGLLEVVSIFVRRRNRGIIRPGRFQLAVSQLQTEMLLSPVVTQVEASDQLAGRALPLIDTHSINGNDALILRSALDIATQVRSAGSDLVLVSSDHRLLRAAQAEGLTTFDPETQSTADLDALV